MPDYMTNKVSIETDDENIIKFFAENEYSFNLFIPQPDFETYQQQHEWRCENWGTKSDCVDLELTFNKFSDGMTEIELSFLTAWHAPIPIFKTMEETFAGHFQQAVFGMFAMVVGIYRDGELHTGDFEEAPDRTLEYLGMLDDWDKVREEWV